MIDTSSTSSLALRARRLTALARAKREDEKESQDLGQVQTALNRLDQELTTLKAVLHLHGKLKAAGADVVDIQGLLGPPQKLQSHVNTVGRPTAQFLTARTRDVTSARSALEDTNTQAWRAWSSQRLENLPTSLLPRVPLHRRGQASTRLAALRKLAAGTPTITDIIQFQQSYDLVKEDLDRVEVATVDRVLERFQGGRIRLADLSETELEMLRDDEELRDQLYVHLNP